jgi:hypothetical protein
MKKKVDNTKGYKIRDKITGKFLNGDYRVATFTDKGHTWASRARLDSSLSSYIRSTNRRSTNLIVPKTWEIVEVELIEEIKNTSSASEILRHILIRRELEPKGHRSSYFYDRMVSLGIADQIEFIFALKPTSGKRWIDMECIKEARAQLRLLGVKTRTYRESRGIFGMMNREQAMKARLVLEVEDVIDLQEIRTQIDIILTP